MKKCGFWKYSIFLFIFIVVFCSREEEECPDGLEAYDYDFTGTYESWLSEWKDTSFEVHAISSDGLSESYKISSGYGVETHEDWNDCYDLIMHTRYYYYKSSIYGHIFIISLSFQGNYVTRELVPYVKIDYDNKNNNHYAAVTVFLDTFYFKNSRTEIIRYEQHLNDDKFYLYESLLNFVDTVTINNKTYHEVYKYDNPAFKLIANPLDLVEFYINKRYGLLQFTFMNGRIWTLNI